MDCAELRTCLLAFFADSYPNMEIIVEPWREAPGRLAIYFIEEKFGLIYPRQRYHYVTHLIPTEFQEKWLQNSVWFELAPGEAPEQLDYHDDAVLAEITEPIMDILQKTSFSRRWMKHYRVNSTRSYVGVILGSQNQSCRERVSRNQSSSMFCTF
jgi:hypothetical protein